MLTHTHTRTHTRVAIEVFVAILGAKQMGNVLCCAAELCHAHSL